MAKPHKFAWNGIDVETTLSIEQLANMAQRAAQECTGDLIHGKHRIVSVKSTERRIEFRINDFLITFKKFMVFYLDFEVRNGRTWMSSRIDWYVTTQPTVGGFIPVAAKSMVGHHTYMQFVHHLADQVSRADPQARVSIREGVATTGPASAVSAPSGAPAAPTPEQAPPTAAVPPAASRPAQPASVPPPMPPPIPGFQPLRPPPPPPGLAPPIGAPSGPPAPPPPTPSIVRPAVPPAPPPPTPTIVRPAVPSVGPVPSPVPHPAAGTGNAGGSLVTSVPGMPRRETPPEERQEESVPGGYASIAEQLFAEDEDLFHTRIVQAGASALPWVLRLPDSREVLLSGPLVLGRNPAAPDGSGAAPVGVNDPQRSVSKTHALIELRSGLPWVTDLHSTNGTTLTNDIGEALVCEPGAPVPVGDGWVLGLGEYAVTIVRQPGQG